MTNVMVYCESPSPSPVRRGGVEERQDSDLKGHTAPLLQVTEEEEMREYEDQNGVRVQSLMEAEASQHDRGAFLAGQEAGELMPTRVHMHT
jgi:hypothetical protein